jgi:hypothetical protein
VSERRTLYPPIAPSETGMLAVGDGHQIYWERVGTPGAKPAVYIQTRSKLSERKMTPRTISVYRSGYVCA